MKIHEKVIDGVKYQIGYKVFVETEVNGQICYTSTGLNGTRIIGYSSGMWNHHCDGIWAARIPSFAKYVRSYIAQRYGKKTKTFIVAVRDILEVTKNAIRAKEMRVMKELGDESQYDVSAAISRKI